jgi:hypothetical protein
LKRELVARGFTVDEHEFVAEATRLEAVALAGVVLVWGAIGAVLMMFLSPAILALNYGVPIAWTMTVFALLIHTLVTGRARTGDSGVRGTNLIGSRARPRPAVWLVAHYDSKGQPISMATRLVAVALAIVGVLGLAAFALSALGVLVLTSLQLSALAAAGVVGGILLSRSQVTDDSPGAVDNASALAAVFAILDQQGATRRDVGVIFTDGEELGLLGARALVEGRAELIAGAAVVNLDGLDDAGRPIVLTHRGGPLGDAVAAELRALRAPWLPVVVDGIELRGPARECLTILKGTWATARIVHTPRDTADRLTLAGVREVAAGIARAVGRVDARPPGP